MAVSPAALRNLAQLLKTEDDLDKVEHLKAQLHTEKSSIDVHLKSLTQLQLDRFMNDIVVLSQCKDDVKTLKDSLDRVNNIASESFGSISRYELINNITHVHEIFDQSNRIAERLGKFSSELSQVRTSIIEELENPQDPEYANLLIIHYSLNELRDLRDQLMELGLRSSDDNTFTLKRATSGLDEVVKKFDELLGNLIFDLIGAVQEGCPTLVVRIANVIEFEEKQDLRIDSLTHALQAKNKGKKGEVSLFDEIVHGTLQGRTKPRHYKDLFIKKITESVKDTFKNCWTAFEESENVFDILDNLEWFYNDLACVRADLSKLVPPKWNIFEVYHDLYSHELQNIIVRLINLEPETQVILRILDFENDHQKIMANELGLKKSEIKSSIGEKELEQLLADYLNLLVMKMTEWMGNLEKTEQEFFKSRIQAPDADSEGKLALEGTKIVFQMFSQQCDAASGSGQGKILAGVISQFAKQLLQRQQKWSDSVKSEVQMLLMSNSSTGKDTEGGVNEVPAGLDYYLTALANDQMRSANYTESISNKYGSMVSKKYASLIHNDLEGVVDGFANLAKQCCDGLIVIIFDELKHVLDLIFTKEWQTSNLCQQIAGTLLEYLGNAQTDMDNYLFEIFAEEVLEECILRYLSALNNDIKFPKHAEKLLSYVKRDFEAFFKLFVDFVNQEVIQSKFKIVENFMDLSTETDLDQIVVHWKATVANFNDIKPEFLSLVLKARRDIDSSDAKAILPRAKEAQNEYLQENQYSLEPSFMGRFSLSTKLKKNYM